jgi:uncharacterized paraquat-inducible protein A
MIYITYEEFKQLVSLRHQGQKTKEQAGSEQEREKVLRPDQLIQWTTKHEKSLATCPSCDAVVNADILHPQSGLCPICHDEMLLRRWH